MDEREAGQAGHPKPIQAAVENQNTATTTKLNAQEKTQVIYSQEFIQL